MSSPEHPATAARVSTLSTGLAPGVAREVIDVGAAAARTDGVAPLSEQPLLRLRDAPPIAHHLLARDPGDHRLLGYAQVDLTPAGSASAELVVTPEARRRGIGAALLAEVRRLAAEAGHPELQVWAHGDLPGARALATSAGMTVVRELWQMRLDLTSGGIGDPPVPELPGDVTVREFVPGADEDAWCQVNARAFRDHPEQGRLTRADVEAREREPWFDPAGFLLAERNGTLVASVWTKVHPAVEPVEPVEPVEHSDEPVGEIYALGVDPGAQGLGLGGALTSLALVHLRSRGLRSVILYTEGENAVAIRTYQRAGFVRSAIDVAFGSCTTGTRASDTMSA